MRQVYKKMKVNDDIFGCFGNSCIENITACCFPCYTYGQLIHDHNNNPIQKDHQAECNFCTGLFTYGCFICCPCFPGSYLRILQGEEAFTGCLSYSFFPCCSLQQDNRRTKPKT